MDYCGSFFDCTFNGWIFYVCLKRSRTCKKLWLTRSESPNCRRSKLAVLFKFTCSNDCSRWNFSIWVCDKLDIWKGVHRQDSKGSHSTSLFKVSTCTRKIYRILYNKYYVKCICCNPWFFIWMDHRTPRMVSHSSDTWPFYIISRYHFNNGLEHPCCFLCLLW